MPTNRRLLNGNVTVSNRLFDNIQSGYAIWTNWQTVAQNPALLTNLVEQANARSKTLIQNQREVRTKKRIKSLAQLFEVRGESGQVV